MQVDKAFKVDARKHTHTHTPAGSKYSMNFECDLNIIGCGSTDTV